MGVAIRLGMQLCSYDGAGAVYSPSYVCRRLLLQDFALRLAQEYIKRKLQITLAFSAGLSSLAICRPLPTEV